MDAIATAAGVSKPTVYNHFADKQQLFEQIVSDRVAGITQPFDDQIDDLSDGGDLAEPLRELAKLLLKGVMQPANLQLRRLVIGEASRFPDLGRAYEQQGPQQATVPWTTAFKRLAENGLLRMEDPALSAHFNWLVVSIPLNHAMLSGDTGRRDPASSSVTPTVQSTCFWLPTVRTSSVRSLAEPVSPKRARPDQHRAPTPTDSNSLPAPGADPLTSELRRRYLTTV
jgi:AcrR family transcriptional regulator